MRLLVVGAGSTGGYYGGRLAHAGRDVTFLVRPARAAQLEAKGLHIVSPYGDVALKPKLVTAGNIGGHFDAILITVKAFALEAALDDIAPAVGPNTMIVPVLNGMRHVDVLLARFGKAACVGGLCSIVTQLDREGRIVHSSKFHNLVYGEMDGTQSQRIEELDAFMQNAGFDARLSAVIELEMWEKWTMLASLAGVTCLMRGTIGEIVAAPGGSDFINRFFVEVVAVISAAGLAPREKFVADTRAMLTAPGSALNASMFRDMQARGRIEADQIIGDLLERGTKAGVSTPLLSLAYTHLRTYQNRHPA
jgi:2-dehydropantoate 2-reductase